MANWHASLVLEKNKESDPLAILVLVTFKATSSHASLANGTCKGPTRGASLATNAGVTVDNSREERARVTAPSPSLLQFGYFFRSTPIFTSKETQMHYVDGYVIAVPNEKKEDYLKLARDTAPMFKDHGALAVVECWGDDVPPGKLTSFPLAVQATEDETVVFSWILWPSREARDKGMAAFMADPRMKQPESMPFDPKRMIFGGFQVILDM